jgi:hypothetical protein
MLDEFFTLSKLALLENSMKVNMGMLDRGFRLGLAIVVSLLNWTGAIDGVVGFVAIALAGIFLLTSFVGFCPSYLPLKISTKKES